MITLAKNRVQEGIELIDAMDADELNQLIDYIRETVKAKRSQANAKAKAALEVGDRVRLTGRYKPQYLQGLTGKVVEKLNTRVVVQLDRPVGKFTTGEVHTNAAGLTVIN